MKFLEQNPDKKDCVEVLVVFNYQKDIDVIKGFVPFLPKDGPRLHLQCPSFLVSFKKEAEKEAYLLRQKGFLTRIGLCNFKNAILLKVRKNRNEFWNIHAVLGP